MSQPVCLRCDQVELIKSVDAPSTMTFFVCPRCGRNYALAPGKALTFRWRHPISLALYPMIFTEKPAEAGVKFIDAQLAHFTPDDLEAAVSEIELELETPTQQVRDILDCAAPEAELRAYLQRFCERAELRRITKP